MTAHTRPWLGLLTAAMLAGGTSPAIAEPEPSGSQNSPLRISDVLSEETARVDSGRLLVLGSPHLAQEFEDDFDPEWLDGLNEVLVDFSPEVIAVEVLRPQDILTKRHLDDQREDWDRVLDMFVSGVISRAETVRENTDMSWAEARQDQRELLEKAEAGTLDSEQRRELIAASLAAYDYHTGLLHWAHLDESERTAEQGLTEDIVDSLDNGLDSPNESIQIGVLLAAELGLQRVHQIDDQLSLGVQTMEEHQRLQESLQESGILEEVMEIYEDATAEAMEQSQEKDDLLPLYRRYNSDTFSQLDIGTQWAAFFDERLDEDLARTRMARREVRDLSIAANVREASARYPGQDVLVVIGASHRPFLESYLSDMTDLEIIQLKELLD